VRPLDQPLYEKAMTKEEVTLIAAVIAASASIFTIIMNLRAQKSSELRVSYRDSLEPQIAELGEALHEIVATTNIYLFKTKSNEAKQNWRQKHENARDNIKALRKKVRYQLWGIDEGLRAISRVGDHATHLTEDNVRASKLMEAATNLREKLDKTIKNCYQRGAAPTRMESWLVSRAAKKITEVFNDFAPGNDQNA